MSIQLNSFDNWYSLTKCEYPQDSYRLCQHSVMYDEDAFVHRGMSTTNVCEGDFKALLEIAKSNHLDVWGDDGILYMEG